MHQFRFQLFSQVSFAILLSLIGLLAGSPLAWADLSPRVTKVLTISNYGMPVSFDEHPQGGQYVVAFRDCELVFLDATFKITQAVAIPNCRSLFGAKYGYFNQQLMVVSPVYVGESVIYDFSAIHRIKTHNAAVTGSFLVNNDLISTSDDGSVTITEILNLAELKTEQQELYKSIGVARKIAIYPDLGGPVSRLAISYDTGEIVVFPNKANLRSPALKPQVFRPIKSRINTIRFTPDGQSLVAGYFTGELLKLDLSTGQSQVLGRAEFWLNTIDMTPEGLLVTGNSQGIVKLFSIPNEQEILAQQIGQIPIASVEFINPNTVLVVDAKGNLYQLQF
ncbi:hypothetical protein Syn6312_1331 [Synechococcus sp. PCC 6312]|nr:hypothetical protein Syn6312_1331 [Synechococcus sp. PCC 6312]